MTKFYRKGYPRPQFVRDSYYSLNGDWKFSFDDANAGETSGWYNGFEEQCFIRVPFSYESKLSGIAAQRHCNCVWYERAFQFLPQAGQRVLLYFEGCDYLTKVWVNGKFVGSHMGGYTRFCFDITDCLDNFGNARITVQAQDSTDTTRPRGKQQWLTGNYDCWYLQTTGIWKSVWAECVSAQRLENVKITPEYDTNNVEFSFVLAAELQENEDFTLKTVITYGDRMIYQGSDRLTSKYYTKIAPLSSSGFKWKVETWSLEHPNLYDVEFLLYRGDMLIDRAGSYFGVRKVAAETNRITLNNMEVYLRMVLDQGYWEDGLLTPPDEDAIIADLKSALAYGYNGVRKHQKIEDESFYYWADVLGILIWCESPSIYEFNESAVEAFTREWISIVAQHQNHPSIICWVPFNESWGLQKIYCDRKQQHFTEAIYHLTKSIDDTRPVIVNDGWEHTISDIITIHDYAQTGAELALHMDHVTEFLENRKAFNDERFLFAKGYSYRGQPIVISEFGGIAFAKEDGWGYGKAVQDEKSFLERFAGLINTIKNVDFVCGFCYTQLADVQQEVNGHANMRRKDKIDREKIREIILGNGCTQA